MSYPKIYDETQWKIQIQLANSVFSRGYVEPSTQHYQSALSTAKQLFNEFKSVTPLPDTLIHIMIISYMNLADCWGAQHKKKEQIHCLIESYDFLKALLSDHSEPQSLHHQAYSGVNKIYLELCFCFKEISADGIINQIEDDFAELSLLYQAQSSVAH